MATSFASVLLIAVATLQVAFATYYYPPCDPPHRLNYGRYTPYGRTKYPIGSKINFYCNDGYKLYGSSYTICKYNKRSYWSHPHPVCKPIRCPTLKDIPYGSVKMTGNKPRDTAHYRCDKGFKLVGDAWRKCLYNGYWSGKEPVCKPIRCPDLKDIPYGSVKMTGNKPRDTAHYRCDKGFKLVGDAWRKCLYSGYWSGKEPVCKKIICPHLDHPQYGKVRVEGYGPSSKAYYSCNDGYVRYGLAYRKCLSDGTWYGKSPVCRKKIVVCPHLPHPQYGKVRVEGYTPLSKAYYSCDYGYVRYGLSYRKCQSDGTWYGKPPVCHPRKYGG